MGARGKKPLGSGLAEEGSGSWKSPYNNLEHGGFYWRRIWMEMADMKRGSAWISINKIILKYIGYY
jgi:hypothetical protein